MRTKHPQLLYETKLYRILQGGGKFLAQTIFKSVQPLILVEKIVKISADQSEVN